MRLVFTLVIRRRMISFCGGTIILSVFNVLLRTIPKNQLPPPTLYDGPPGPTFELELEEAIGEPTAKSEK